MNRLLIAFIGASLLLCACGAYTSIAQDVSASSDALALAREGSLLCFRPRAERKECNTLLLYSFGEGGTVRVKADVTMSREVVMSSNFEATIKSGAVCSVAREEDLRTATFTILGRPASASETQSMREYLANRLQTRPRSEVCLTFNATPEGLIAEATIDGVRYPQMDQPVIWVSPSDGFVAHP